LQLADGGPLSPEALVLAQQQQQQQQQQPQRQQMANATALEKELPAPLPTGGGSSGSSMRCQLRQRQPLEDEGLLAAAYCVSDGLWQDFVAQAEAAGWRIAQVRCLSGPAAIKGTWLLLKQWLGWEGCAFTLLTLAEQLEPTRGATVEIDSHPADDCDQPPYGFLRCPVTEAAKALHLSKHNICMKDGFSAMPLCHSKLLTTARNALQACISIA
jgi:hypothetical protein